MIRWIVVFFLTIVLACSAANGQTDTLTKSRAKINDRFIKSAGLNLAFGNAPSTTGWIGFSFIISSKYFDFLGGWGWNNVRKYNLGVCYHQDLKKQFSPFISSELVLSTKRDFVFNNETPNERHYQVNPAQFINFGAGIMWRSKKMAKNKHPWLFIKSGYRQRISDYLITPKDATKSNDSEINTIYHDFFKPRLFYTVGIRIDFDTSE